MKNIPESLVKFPSTIKIQGKQVPNGRVRVSGAKNSGTRLLAASSLTDEQVVLTNFPTLLVDAQHKMNFLREIGFNVEVDYTTEQVSVLGGKISYEFLASYDFPIRTTYLLAAAQLVRNGIARIPYPGGCKIGSRGYDLHILVWESLGCVVTENELFIEIEGNLTGGIIDFPKSTVGGTENALMCAAVATGKTIIHNAYVTPEVLDLVEMLTRMGAQITVIGNSYIEVEGKSGLLSGTRMPVMPDRIEALTWIIVAILTGGTILIEDVPFAHMEIPLIHLEEAGINIFRNETSAYVSPACLKPGGIQPFELACGTHPGVISDMQPFYVLLALAASGTSRVYDYRYPKRIGYVDELQKFFPNSFVTEEGCITIFGRKENSSNAIVESTDLRGSMAVMMAALLVDGESQINDAHMALRGYNNLLKKFRSLGVEISEIDD
jgi:UDP-N-acetylglucosamine 1-carboxyvinyltransferase